MAECIADAARRQHSPLSTAHHPTAQQPGIATASFQTLTHSPPLADSSPPTHSPPFQCSSCDIVRAASQEYSAGTEVCRWCVDGTLLLHPESEFQWCHASRHEVNSTQVAHTNILPSGDHFTACITCQSSSQHESPKSDGSQRLPPASRSSYRPRSDVSDDEYGTPFSSRGPDIDEFVYNEDHGYDEEEDDGGKEPEDDEYETDDLRLYEHDGGHEREDEDDEVDERVYAEHDTEDPVLTISDQGSDDEDDQSVDSPPRDESDTTPSVSPVRSSAEQHHGNAADDGEDEVQGEHDS
ncbi:hypothetical protein TI39_contig336g00015 [Zymoseptoria brevis]|uniref:Uncharacterized protein n=1 Tax=Zymoseptoria brevis TaxID=1047168 RepID=A0A0F4GVT0_9PEZI|nr:hypothetical protein TI39_contig336g00015 [Zymoseptoria brevis]